MSGAKYAVQPQQKDRGLKVGYKKFLSRGLNDLQTAKVILRLDIILMTRETPDQTHDPWFTS